MLHMARWLGHKRGVSGHSFWGTFVGVTPSPLRSNNSRSSYNATVVLGGIHNLGFPQMTVYLTKIFTSMTAFLHKR